MIKTTQEFLDDNKYTIQMGMDMMGMYYVLLVESGLKVITIRKGFVSHVGDMSTEEILTKPELLQRMLDLFEMGEDQPNSINTTITKEQILLELRDKTIEEVLD
tara:strand:+ start:6543 stop:6854 length:312 start_codon:yes stop_codon:yes gene_type:complete